MKKQRTRGSHYLPCVYLKHFLFGGKLIMYKKGKKFFSDSIKPQERIVEVKGERGLKKIAKENYLYRIDIANMDPNTIENLFREMMEDDFDSLVQKINRKNIGEKLDEELKEKISLFMSIMKVRTPSFKWEVGEVATAFTKKTMSLAAESFDIGKSIKRYELETGKKVTKKEAEKIRKEIVEGKYDLEHSNNLFLKTALMLIKDYTNIFLNMKMNIFKASKNEYFLTSDNPVVWFVPKDKVDFYNSCKSLMSPFTEVFFSLTKDISIHLCRREDFKEMIMPTNKEVLEITNMNISHNSMDFIFSPSKEDSLNKFIEDYIPYPLKIVIS